MRDVLSASKRREQNETLIGLKRQATRNCIRAPVCPLHGRFGPGNLLNRPRYIAVPMPVLIRRWVAWSGSEVKIDRNCDCPMICLCFIACMWDVERPIADRCQGRVAQYSPPRFHLHITGDERTAVLSHSAISASTIRTWSGIHR